ncbi:MAG TPA: glycosyltransferase family 4 protein [Vicinamibacterales bacterium]
MKVLHLLPQLRLGAGRYVVDLAKQQAKRGHEVRVLVSADAEPPFTTDPALAAELRGAGVAVDVAGDFFRRRVPSLIEASRVVRAVAGSAEWLAHAHTAMAAAVARRAGATALIGTCHGVAPDRPQAMDVQDFLAWSLCDRVTTPSQAWARRLSSEFGVLDVAVVPVGIDLTRYPPVERRPGGAPLRIVCVAEQTHRKGLDLLIEAVARAARAGLDVTCHFFGRGDAAAELRRTARSADPDGRRFVFAGHVAEPYSRLGGFDLFALPSRADNQPVAAIEAMLAGLPLVVSDVGGLGDLVRSSDGGWVVHPEDAGALTRALASAVRAGREALQHCGHRAAAYARQTFDVTRTARRFDALYAGALRAAAAVAR